MQYQVRVLAFNSAGIGEPSVMPVTVQPAERFEPPEISPDAELRKNIVVKAGNSVRHDNMYTHFI